MGKRKRRRLPRFKPDKLAPREDVLAAFEWATQVESAVNAPGSFVERIARDVENGFKGAPRSRWTSYHVATFMHAILGHLLGLPAYRQTGLTATGGPDLGALVPPAFLWGPPSNETNESPEEIAG